MCKFGVSTGGQTRSLHSLSSMGHACASNDYRVSYSQEHILYFGPANFELIKTWSFQGQRRNIESDYDDILDNIKRPAKKSGEK